MATKTTNGNAVLIETFENDTDFLICVFNCALYYVVTIYDVVSRKHDKQKTFAGKDEAINFAEEINKKYFFE